jgi:hypothetical protein
MKHDFVRFWCRGFSCKLFDVCYIIPRDAKQLWKLSRINMEQDDPHPYGAIEFVSSVVVSLFHGIFTSTV